MLSDDPRPLWVGYDQPGAMRRPSEVCVPPEIGLELQRLCWTLCPHVVVEVGTGFGASGWHLLHGLASGLPRPTGHLYTFEANPEWAREARKRLMGANASGFTLAVGRFEDLVDEALAGKTVDLAFIDAIHTDEQVLLHWQAIVKRRSQRLVVAVDDIGATPGAWDEITRGAVSSSVYRGRLGVVEV